MEFRYNEPFPVTASPDHKWSTAKNNNINSKKMNTFKEYEDFVKSMKVYPEKYSIVYPALGLAEEAGEVAGKVKRWLRGDGPLDRLAILKELGDILWYATSEGDDLGFTLQDIINTNVEKLTSRKERNLIKGSGDNR